MQAAAATLCWPTVTSDDGTSQVADSGISASGARGVQCRIGNECGCRQAYLPGGATGASLHSLARAKQFLVVIVAMLPKNACNACASTFPGLIDVVHRVLVHAMSDCWPKIYYWLGEMHHHSLPS
jgi:hypothetical protein